MLSTNASQLESNLHRTEKEYLKNAVHLDSQVWDFKSTLIFASGFTCALTLTFTITCACTDSVSAVAESVSITPHPGRLQPSDDSSRSAAVEQPGRHSIVHVRCTAHAQSHLLVPHPVVSM